MWEQIQLLITVKTYPHPSPRYVETVCTGGLARDGRWIRLYPVPFRLLSAAPGRLPSPPRKKFPPH